MVRHIDLGFKRPRFSSNLEIHFWVFICILCRIILLPYNLQCTLDNYMYARIGSIALLFCFLVVLENMIAKGKE